MQALENKVALVTGGAGGIGSAICRQLAEAGASVVITYNSNAQKAQALLDTLAPGHHAVVHAPNDDPNRVAALADFLADTYNRLDILVNNAGVTTPVPHDDLDGLTDD